MAVNESATAEDLEAVLCGRLELIRLQRNITQAALAQEAGVALRTIRRMEKGEGTSLATFIRVLKALKLADRLDTVLPPQQIQPIERVKATTRVRERATGSRKKKPSEETPWTWGDE